MVQYIYFYSQIIQVTTIDDIALKSQYPVVVLDKNENKHGIRIHVYAHCDYFFSSEAVVLL